VAGPRRCDGDRCDGDRCDPIVGGRAPDPIVVVVVQLHCRTSQPESPARDHLVTRIRTRTASRSPQRVRRSVSARTVRRAFGTSDAGERLPGREPQGRLTGSCIYLGAGRLPPATAGVPRNHAHCRRTESRDATAIRHPSSHNPGSTRIANTRHVSRETYAPRSADRAPSTPRSSNLRGSTRLPVASTRTVGRRRGRVQSPAYARAGTRTDRHTRRSAAISRTSSRRPERARTVRRSSL
jgi:hypothetical protein